MSSLYFAVVDLTAELFAVHRVKIIPCKNGGITLTVLSFGVGHIYHPF